MNSSVPDDIAVDGTVNCSLENEELAHVSTQKLQNLTLSTECHRKNGVSPCSSDSYDDLHPAMQTGEPKKWTPPKIPPNNECIVDITHEKPSGRYAITAWCCIVKIRSDHVICYAPVPEIHKVLVKADLLERALSCEKATNVVKLGNWINLTCELRCKREYDDVRPPHFSHIATRVCSVPRINPPIESWNQRLISNLLQIFLHFDLSKAQNVRRASAEGEKYFILNSTHTIPVLVPVKRLDQMIDTNLTADKVIAFWATRLRRVLKCDMFLLDSEEIVEVTSESKSD
ncbi:hypothetical protein KIN20_034664 [Parelaphostrongylus tenuis]|uniref:Uncharacterized protein n=1 Tax=Parelaphostrongylus tenuis TaxID=148309 RepID=A0AAD5RA07_PARTN|nr:hypothetical protein KIN20_034664 [Parelaphostrongylus tenuis]